MFEGRDELGALARARVQEALAAVVPQEKINEVVDNVMRDYLEPKYKDSDSAFVEQMKRFAVLDLNKKAEAAIKARIDELLKDKEALNAFARALAPELVHMAFNSIATKVASAIKRELE